MSSSVHRCVFYVLSKFVFKSRFVDLSICLFVLYLQCFPYLVDHFHVFSFKFPYFFLNFLYLFRDHLVDHFHPSFKTFSVPFSVFNVSIQFCMSVIQSLVECLLVCLSVCVFVGLYVTQCLFVFPPEKSFNLIGTISLINRVVSQSEN